MATKRKPQTPAMPGALHAAAVTVLQLLDQTTDRVERGTVDPKAIRENLLICMDLLDGGLRHG